ncbi:MAG TPA: polysaccharide deacetylase family protein, partial [Dongiaceae bacterium]|nr:polysaccharide deacetylase family protein [Dongiaceae bacterium]
MPILMYHSISDDPEPGVAPYYRVNTSPSVFRQHIQFLADHSYRTIGLDDLLKLLRASGGDPPGNRETEGAESSLSLGPLVARRPSVVITFDDGFRNFFTAAFPALQAHGFTATMFLPTGFIGRSRRHFAPRSTLHAPRSTSAE